MGHEASLYLGVGSIDDVAVAVTNIPDSDNEIRHYLLNIAGLLKKFPDGHPYRSSLNAILCAFFNQRSLTHHWVYMADEHNEINREWLPNKATREMILQISGIVR